MKTLKWMLIAVVLALNSACAAVYQPTTEQVMARMSQIDGDKGVEALEAGYSEVQGLKQAIQVAAMLGILDETIGKPFVYQYNAAMYYWEKADIAWAERNPEKVSEYLALSKEVVDSAFAKLEDLAKSFKDTSGTGRSVCFTTILVRAPPFD